MVRDGICGQSAGEKMAVAVSNSFYVVFEPLLVPIPNFIQIGQKTQKLKNFRYWSVLVDRAGRSKNGRRHFKLISCCFLPNISPYSKFHPNRKKTQKLKIFNYLSVLVGWATRTKNGHRHRAADSRCGPLKKMNVWAPLS